jgi:hypothetical protein
VFVDLCCCCCCCCRHRPRAQALHHTTCHTHTGLKRHSVSLFEGGRVSGASVVDELITELQASAAAGAIFEGDDMAQVCGHGWRASGCACFGRCVADTHTHARITARITARIPDTQHSHSCCDF